MHNIIMDSHFLLLFAGSPAQINSHVSKVSKYQQLTTYFEQGGCLDSKAADLCEEGRVIDTGVGTPSCKQLRITLP